jgi:hypothetical protein
VIKHPNFGTMDKDHCTFQNVHNLVFGLMGLAWGWKEVCGCRSSLLAMPPRRSQHQPRDLLSYS